MNVTVISTSLAGLDKSAQKAADSAQKIANFGTQAATTLPQDEINISEEAIKLQLASVEYKANLKALEATQEMERDFIDTFTKKS